MKTKTSKILIICLSAVALALLLALAALIVNPISYYDFEQDGYSFEYKGSFGTARRVIIRQDGEKLSSVRVSTDADTFDSPDALYAIIADLDGDADDDIIIPIGIDEEDDVLCSAFLADGKKLAECKDRALANPTFEAEEGMIYTEETVKDVIQEATKTNPEFYELTEKIAKHAFIDGALISLEERAIIYYSENDYYCYSIYEYSEETKDLAYVDEIWFDPIKLDQYPLNWD